MKKVSSIALALLFAASAFAYEQIGQLNPYAYGVSGTAKNNKIAVAYSLNSPADSTIIAIYRDGEEVGTQVVADNAPGLHSAVVDIAAFGTAGTYTVGVRVYGKSYDKPTQLREIKDGSTDTTALCYAFYHPKGVEIDRNPFSEYFGRLSSQFAWLTAPPALTLRIVSVSPRTAVSSFPCTTTPALRCTRYLRTSRPGPRSSTAR